MVILVDVDDRTGFEMRFFRVDADESVSEPGLEPEFDPFPAEETLEATEDTFERST